MNTYIAHDMRLLLILGLLAVLVAVGICTGCFDESAELERHAAWEAEVAETDWVMW